MRARPILTLLALLALAAAALAAPAAARAAHRSSWTRLASSSVCIGGARCGNYGDLLELPLAGAPVEAVRFYAHDDVGRKYKGRLRVSIDGRDLTSYGLDVKRAGSYHELDGYGIPGRYLVFHAATDDEVVIEDVEVLYGGHRRSRHYEPVRRHDRSGWRRLPRAAGCFGGEICDHYGWALDVQLSGAPVWGVRFYAHDRVGDKTGGRLRISLDGTVLAHDLDVKRAGGVFELDVHGLPGRHLVFEAITHDEVVVDDVEILYGRGHGYRHGYGG